jgi:hypothetical protein
MPISEKQLEVWSHIGSINQSSSTYNNVRDYLIAILPSFGIQNFTIFLQGSYANNTNIYAESDVDVIVQRNDCFYHDLERLSENERNAYAARYAPISSSIDHKSEILNILTKKFGSLVSTGDKAINISSHSCYRKVDVIPAYQYRNYYKFYNFSEGYDEGIFFFRKDGSQIINYPKQHSQNLTKKHQATNGWLKPIIRIFKNLNARLIDNRMLLQGTAPSYFIEGLLYNVPNEYFKYSYQECLCNIMNWIQTAEWDKFICANEQYYLFQDGFSITWPKESCKKFMTSMIEFWNQS